MISAKQQSCSQDGLLVVLECSVDVSLTLRSLLDYAKNPVGFRFVEVQAFSIVM
jgi:hypothetical protein